jgi:hypothetical protein
MIGFHLLNPKAPLANPEPPKQRTEIRIDPRLLDNYTGRHQVAPNLIFEITRDGDRLFAQGFAQLPHNRPGDLTGLPKFELFAEGEKHFFARVADHEISFETGPEGRAASLLLRRADRDTAGARHTRYPSPLGLIEDDEVRNRPRGSRAQAGCRPFSFSRASSIRSASAARS